VRDAKKASRAGAGDGLFPVRDQRPRARARGQGQVPCDAWENAERN
jgi:hypothetical protein